MCLALGVPHPRHLGRLLTSAELEEWAQYADLVGGIGDSAANRRTAALIAAEFEPHRDRNKHPKRFRWEEMAHWLLPAAPERPRSVDDEVAAFDRAFGVQ